MGERGYAPIHVYETGSGRPVAFILRPARTPSGREIRGHVRRLIQRIRSHWSQTRITLRGDGHYARPEVMAWCEAQGIDYIFGLPGNSVLRKDPVIAATADACAVFRAKRGLIAHREHCETRYAAKSWKVARRVVARIEASAQGMDIRTIVTSIQGSTPERLYELDYCDRGHPRRDDGVESNEEPPRRPQAVGHERQGQVSPGRPALRDRSRLPWFGRCRRLAKDWEASIASADAWVLVAAIRRSARFIARKVTREF